MLVESLNCIESIHRMNLFKSIIVFVLYSWFKVYNCRKINIYTKTQACNETMRQCATSKTITHEIPFDRRIVRVHTKNRQWKGKTRRKKPFYGEFSCRFPSTTPSSFGFMFESLLIFDEQVSEWVRARQPIDIRRHSRRKKQTITNFMEHWLTVTA